MVAPDQQRRCRHTGSKAMTDRNIKTTSSELDLDQLEAVSGGKTFQVVVKWQPTLVKHSKASG
jgi:hypothetical protein